MCLSFCPLIFSPTFEYSLCCPQWFQTHNPPVSSFRMLGVQFCAVAFCSDFFGSGILTLFLASFCFSLKVLGSSWCSDKCSLLSACPRAHSWDQKVWNTQSMNGSRATSWNLEDLLFSSALTYIQSLFLSTCVPVPSSKRHCYGYMLRTISLPFSPQ